jgi:hypothetical protein
MSGHSLLGITDDDDELVIPANTINVPKIRDALQITQLLDSSIVGPIAIKEYRVVLKDLKRLMTEANVYDFEIADAIKTITDNFDSLKGLSASDKREKIDAGDLLRSDMKKIIRERLRSYL